jgi:hypothetical protein
VPQELAVPVELHVPEPLQ